MTERTKESVEADYERQRQARVESLVTLYNEYGKRSAWNLLGEALPLLLGRSPEYPTIAGMPFDEVRPDGLTKSEAALAREFQRAIDRHELPALQNPADEAEITIRPATFVAYLKSKNIPHHLSLADAVGRHHAVPDLPTPALTAVSSQLHADLDRIINAGYPIDRIQAALAATTALWLAYDPVTGENRPTGKVVLSWLKESGIRLTPGERTTIDAFIRHPAASVGGQIKLAKLPSKKSKQDHKRSQLSR